MLTRKNLNKIKGQFSSLLLKVLSALKSHQVSVEKVRSFLIHYFSRNDWPLNLDEIFNALSVAKLWNYDHYDLLEEITKQFLPEDTACLLYTSPSPRDATLSRMPSSA